MDTRLPNEPVMPESSLETARIAWRFMGTGHEEFFRRYLVSGDSEQKIAEELGLNLKTVSDRIAGSRCMLALRSELLLTGWLREKDGNLTRAERIFQAIVPCPIVPPRPDRTEPEDLYDYNIFLESELIEAKKSLCLLDDAVREAFLLHIGDGLSKEKVAEIRKVSVEEVEDKLQDARETIRQRMEQLILGMLRISWEMPEASRMEDTEFEAAKAAFEFVPKQYRKTYFRHLVLGESVDEIANKLHIGTRKVMDRLLEADKIILSRALFMAAATTKRQ